MCSYLKKYNKHIIIFLVICLLFVFSIRFYPREKILHNYTFSKSFFSKDNKLLRITLSYDDKYRIFYPLNEIPKQLQETILMYEDKSFYYHIGINIFSLARAIWSTFIIRNRKIGASTITMQTVRILYNLNTKTIYGKIQQILLSIWLEIRYSKKDILEAYLNIAPYGYNIEGIGAASLVFFNKRLSQTNLLEHLTLAVIPQNPNGRNPSTKDGFKRMKIARNLLYSRWKTKYPQSKDKEHFLNMPMEIKKPKDLPFYLPHITNYLDTITNKNKIFTTINLQLQLLFEEQIKKYIDKNSSLGIKNTSVLLLNAKTMNVEVAVGSANFNDNTILGQNNGIKAKRMAGSILKPFIYAMALEQGLICPTTLIKDTLQYFSIFAPENSDRQFYGAISASDALVNSRNIPAISLLQKVGVNQFLDLLKKAGVSKLKSAEHYGVSAAIGTIDVSVEEMAELYATIINYGKVRKIKYLQDDKEIQTNKTILSKEVSFILFDMLTTNPKPSWFKVKDKNGNEIEVAWKTGTSYCFKDAWSVGIFGDYVLVVWVGNFSGESNSNFWGRTAAGNLFFELIRTSILNKPRENFFPMDIKDLNIKKIKVCSISGSLANKYCPKTKNSYFILGKSPIDLCNVHRNILIDNKTGLRTNVEIKGKTHYEVYEFWPSDILNLFYKAGIKKKSPPNYLPNIDIEDITNNGFAPMIFLPIKDIIYKIEPNSKKIPLKATTDADASIVHWFVDGNFVGTTKTNETLFIAATSGKHEVKAIDDLNRYSASIFNVEYHFFRD